MIPAKQSESGSRRSSILKPTKQRQPLQTVVIKPAITSPSETTPVTSKLKRRVSFAEKKHVKEFCDSFEQGTVWDNTYEENDSSHQKALYSANHNEVSSTSKENFNLIQQSSIIIIDKETDPLVVKLFENELNSQLETELVIPLYDESVSNIENDVSQLNAKDTNLNSPSISNHINATKSPGNSPRAKTPQAPISHYSAALDDGNVSSPAFYLEVPFQDTIYDNQTMTFTKILPSIPQNNKENACAYPNSEERTERNIHNLSMDFTKIVHSSLLKEKKLTNLQLLLDGKETQEDDMEITLETGKGNVDLISPENKTKLNDTSMEMTSAIPSAPLQTFDDNLAQENLSMEITSVVPTMPITANDKEDYERRSFRHSLEFTNTVPSCMGNQATFQSKLRDPRYEITSPNKSMELTLVVTSALETENSSNLKNENIENRTILPQNRSTEFPIVVSSSSLMQNSESNDLEDKSERLFLQKSMEFTKMVFTSLPIKSSSNFTDTGKSAEKKRRISSPRMGLLEMESFNAGHDSNFESCSYIGVEQQLRKSDGISLLNMEFTEPLFHDPLQENLFSSRLETMNPENDVNEDESTKNDTKILQNNSFEFDVPEKSSTESIGVFQACVPSLNNSVLNESQKENDSHEKNDVGNGNLRRNVVITLSEEHADKIQEKEVFARNNSVLKDCEFNSLFNVSTEIRNIPENVRFSDAMLTSSEVLNENEDRTSDFFICNESKTIENIEPPSFLFNQSSRDEQSVDKTLVENEEVLENKKEDLAETSKIVRKEIHDVSNILEQKGNGDINSEMNSIQQIESNEEISWKQTGVNRKRSYESIGILERNDDAEKEVKTINIHEPVKITIHDERLKTRRTSVLERGTPITDCNSSVKIFDAIDNPLEKVSPILSESIRSKRGASGRRYTFVINKQENIKSVDEIALAESNALEARKSYGENTSSNKIVLTRKDPSLFLEEEEEINDKTEMKSDTKIGCVNFLQSQIDFDCPKSGVSCSEKYEDDYQKQDQEIIQIHVEDQEYKNIEEPITDNQKTATIIEDPFSILLENIKSCEEIDECIFDIRCLNETLLAFNFISKSLVVVIKLSSKDEASIRDIKDIQVKSLLNDSVQGLIRIVHNLILSKIRPECLLESYRLYSDVLPLLEHISKEVKLAMNFMFEVRELDDLNMMEINPQNISFVTRTKRMDIILKIMLNIKPFEEIDVNDIHVKCLLGNISTNEIKQLFINVKRDYKFLRRFINDVRDYVELMEEAAAVGK